MELVLASGNSGKLAELRRLLEPLGWRLRAQSEWEIEEAVEDGATFIENALIKARHACRHTGLAALADDSGLVVPALQGAPGIRSARYSGPDADAASNMQLLFANMKHLSGEQRAAHFHCTIVLMRNADDPDPLMATGRWHGRILDAPRGTGGFGYDPLFLPDEPPLDAALSAAELPADVKARVSHRGRALQALLGGLSDGGF